MKLLEAKVGSLKPLLFLVLIIIAVLLRSVNLGEFRPANLGPDEQSWLMVGTSLIETGTPTAWTIFYGTYWAAGINTSATVTPYLDHPPLFSLLVGGWAYWLGEMNMGSLNWELVRIPMIVISVLTIIFTYLFVRRAFGYTEATFVLLAFVFFPSHVVASRIIAAEHFIGLLLMLGLYLFAVFETTKNKRIKQEVGEIMVILCAVSLMIKLWAVVIPGTLCFLALYRRRWKLSVMLILATLVSVLIFAGYGYYYNWEAFVGILKAHQDQAQTFAHFWTFFTKLDIGYFGFFDVSIIVGLIGIIGLAIEKGIKGRGIYVFVPFLVISFLFLYVATGMAYGWYKYLLYPLIAVGLGHVFAQLYRGRYEYLVLFLPMLSMMMQNSNILNDQMDRRFILFIFYGLPVLTLLLRGRFLQLKSVFLSLLIFLFIFEVLRVTSVLGYKLIGAV
jgi:hypothetical protein